MRGKQQRVVVALGPEAAEEELVLLQHLQASAGPKPSRILPREEGDGGEDGHGVGEDAQRGQHHQRPMLRAPADDVRACGHGMQAVGVWPALEGPHHGEGHGRQQCHQQHAVEV